MFFSNEMIEKARTASSAEELREIAKNNGIELSAADAEMYFTFLTKEPGPLADDELDQVAGGKGEASLPAPKYHKDQLLWYRYSPSREVQIKVNGIEHYTAGSGYFYSVIFLDDNSIKYVYLEINENVHD